MSPEQRRSEVARLRRNRPRDAVLRASIGVATALVLYVWLVTDLGLGAFLDGRRWVNLRRFMAEITPYPVHAHGDVRAFVPWLWDRLSNGLEATWITLMLSIVAISGAAAVGSIAALGASRRLVSSDVFLQASAQTSSEAASRSPLGWTLFRASLRGVLILIRAVPEYVWAFFFIALLGPSAWPVILALVMHNAGILGRLGSEVVDDVDPRMAQGLRALGASRKQTVLGAILPEVFPRWLLLFFYRWETCVREATVLGMLGVVSLGYWIQDARARQRLDEMVFLILLSGALVMLGDWLSDHVRRYLRRAEG